MKVWTYVITNDSGAAPNFDPPAVTLASCKPKIRRAAKPAKTSWCSPILCTSAPLLPFCRRTSVFTSARRVACTPWALSQPDREAHLGPAFVCVSLGEPYKDFVYKLAAAIITPEMN